MPKASMSFMELSCFGKCISPISIAMAQSDIT